jgi:L-gulonolactone oxidase
MSSSVSGVDLYEVASRPVASRPVPSKKKSGSSRLVRTQPKTAEDLARILTNPAKFPSPVRPTGSGSSVTRATQTVAGTVVDTTGMDRILALTANTVTVQAGVRLKDLAEHLAHDNLELVGGCVDSNRTVGGAISSGSLGARLLGDGAQLASTVSHITLINGEGRRVEVGENLPELLALIRMSYGLLGIIYAAKLRIRPIRVYSISNNKTDVEEFVRLIPSLMKAQAAVRASLFPFRNRVHVELRYPNEGGQTGKMLPWKLRNWAIQSVLPKVVRSVGLMIPMKRLRDPVIDSVTEATHSLNAFGNAGSNAMEQTGRFTRSMLLQQPVNCTWFFPFDQLAELIPAYRQFCQDYYRRTGYRCDLPTEIWRINQDQASLLSPSYDSAGFGLQIVSTNADGWDDFLLDIAEMAAHFQGVPIFNLTKGFKPGYASRAYGERLERFSTMRQRLDPADRLRNQYFKEQIR